MASKLIDENPSWKKPVLTVLEIVEAHDGESRVVVEDAAAAAWRKSYLQAPSSVVDALVREGDITEQIMVDGQPYDGTLEDVYRDDSIEESAEVDSLLSLTEAGAQTLLNYAPAALMDALFAERAAYIPVFEDVLAACAAEGGATREALEAIVESHDVKNEDGKKVYPQYFIDALESAGGIEWTGVWRTA